MVRQAPWMPILRVFQWFLAIVVNLTLSCMLLNFIIFPVTSTQTTSENLPRNQAGSNKDLTRSLLASENAEGGGYAYLHDWIDTKGMSLWLRLLSLQDPKPAKKQWSTWKRRRVIFTTDTTGIESKSKILSKAKEYSEDYSVKYTSPTHAFMTLSLIETTTFNGINLLSTFNLNLEYAISLSDSNENRYRRRLEADSKLIANSNNNMTDFGSSISIDEWTHIGLTITPALESSVNTESFHKSELIRLYVNGTVVAERVELHRILRDESKLGSFQPLKTEGNRTPKTYLGRTFMRDGGVSGDALDGYISTMALFDYSVTDGKIDGNTTKQQMMNYVNAGFSYRGEDTTLPSFSTKPSNLYTFEETDESELDSVSVLSDIIRGCHGVIRRNIFREPFIRLGGNRYNTYKDGSFVPHKMTTQEMTTADNIARQRRKQIRNGMKHAWEGYRMYAWGKDEIKPLTKRGHDNWGGMGVTLVDSLSTLWLMDMKDEFWEASHWIRNHWSLEDVGPVSVFETTIRSLGGLLSAYDLSGDVMFLETADDLGNRLSNAFNSSTGIPYSETVLNGNHSFNSVWHSQHAVLSELGTLQLEFRYLAALTGKRKYADMVEKVILSMETIQPAHGLYPIYIYNNYSDEPQLGSTKITFGAMGDSFYEYLLKVWLQGGRVETKYRAMYDKAMDGLHQYLVHKTSLRGLTYIADIENKKVEHKMDHLVCFMAGNLALGAYTNPDGLGSRRAKRDLKLGKALAYTCYQMYAHHKSGIAPEFVEFNSKSTDFTKAINAPHYYLRPEAVESFYILNKLTGDPVYREWGWEIFQAIEEHCRSDVAYASLSDVNNPSLGVTDKMESFFLAETLKYLYLLQDPDTEIDLNKVRSHIPDQHTNSKFVCVVFFTSPL